MLALGHTSSLGHASVSSTRMQILGTDWFVSPGSPQGYLHKGVGVGGSMDALTQRPLNRRYTEDKEEWLGTQHLARGPLSLQKD